MHPIICQIGPITIYSYGLMLAVAVFVCCFLLSRDVRPRGIKSETISDLAFWSVLAGIAGARLFYIFLNLRYFLDYPEEMIMIQHGGLAWQGGFIAGALGAITFIRRKKLVLLQMIDSLAPYIALGHAIGRVGCFLNGCCQGREVSWGIYFPVHHARLHPTQLYACVGLVGIYFILKRLLKAPHKDGQIFVFYLILASVNRFIIQGFRADHQPVLGPLDIFQIVSLVIFFSGLAVNEIIKRRKT